MATVIDGTAVAASLRADLTGPIEVLADQGITPGLATVLMSTDPASETYVRMKQRACDEVGIDGIHVEVSPDDSAAVLLDTIDELNADENVDGILVQMPVPEHVDTDPVLERVDPTKDVDGFHPENVGRLVAGNPRFLPCTPHGVLRLLAEAGVDPAGKDVTIVGRSMIVGKPLANMLIQKAAGGNATVTVCHSRTRDLAAHTTGADIVIAAAGVPELIDGSMVDAGATVIDVGVNRVDADTEKGYKLVGDVEFESVERKAAHLTPVPGGVGPMTIAMLLYNTVKAAAAARRDLEVDLPTIMS